MKSNLRHLRVLREVIRTGSVTRAAEIARISQPAVTQAMAKMEALAGQALLLRTQQGFFPTDAGIRLATRIDRALALLDPALCDLSPRLVMTATSAALQALIAMCRTENFTLAARSLGLAQPTVHRAISQLQQEARRPLFERAAHGMIATRAAQSLAQAAQLAFAELDQAESDLAEALGREVGRIVIGAMPLSRSYLLPRTIARFRERRPTLPIRALDGPYDDLMAGLRNGEVDFLIGALRDPMPIGDVVQVPFFKDNLVIVGRTDHPVMTMAQPDLASLFSFPFVVSPEGTPTRLAFDRLTAQAGQPPSLLETGSMILMRELLRMSDHLGCISQLQIQAEIDLGALAKVDLDLPDTERPIGLTLRRDWLPTSAQSDFLDDLKHVISDETGSPVAA